MSRLRPTGLSLALLLVFATSVGLAQAPTPKAKPVTPKPIDDEPKILTAEESAKRRRSSFSDGDDRYGSNEPWSEVPPWKQTSFFGLRARAQTIVFVVDCSESMADEDRLVRAKRELRRSVMAMQFPQRFLVIFYNEAPLPMPGATLKSADMASKDGLAAWLRLIEPDGGTDPRAAMRMAIGFKPDAIYLLSDGLFPDGTAEDIAAKNLAKIPIHCIDLTAGAAGDHLKRIARESGGKYAPRN